uniref:Uncharacterized protein n=2 Tax=Thermofilum pendens TaxID=2269 RepID=A0A7J3X8M8_THEPE
MRLFLTGCRMSIRAKILKAVEIVEDLALSKDIDEKQRKALLQVVKLLSEVQDEIIDAKSRVRELTYTLRELSELLGLEVNLTGPKLAIEDELMEAIDRSSMVELEIDGEKAIVKKLISAQAST